MSDSLHCSGCGQDKSFEAFPWRNTLAGVKRRVCSECVNSTSREIYRRTADKVASRVSERRIGTRSLIESYSQERSCEVCGESDPVVLVFENSQGQAVSSSSLANTGRSFQSLQPDLAGFHVLCLNDQRRRQRSTQGE